MSSIRLRARETSADELPMVCMACGRRAKSHIDKTFSWHPDWVNLTLFLGAVPYVIFAITMRQYMAVEVPVCNRHQSYFQNRTIWIAVLTAATFLIGLLAFLLLLAVGGGDAAGALVGGMACFGISVLPAIGGIAYIQTTTIRAREITERSITLVRVHDEFVDAIEELREGSPRKASRSRRQSDDDDDFDDVEEPAPEPPRDRRESYRERRDPERRPRRRREDEEYE